ncbi:DNA-3-methyladenine glycosylase 2 family protein [Peribacillus cavernae]|uniref:DNA-3-methyladenine glycosylase II n=1 Tax=Peribacillus cavernae TaxID=1674310 RepID=A0A3S0VKF6_9BACI|nr:DNA-3-methyladenine glycosylase [Peribacillus cavernae]MDQ0220422.1 DNA-3-methyladenine glycosylase II [Peribacillus cavernae]RUQ27559.1 DNA-3-methyladenine glycosylase 2 family protein [Peribacillus cavernae]
MWTETLEVQGPYNFDLVLDRLLLDPLHVVDIEKHTIKVPLYIEGEPVVIEIQSTGDTENPVFIIQGELEETKELAVQRLKKVFHWHQPLKEIDTHFKSTDLMEIFEKHRGTAIVLDFDYYSCLVKSIVHQQLNLAFAYKLTERYVKTFGFEKDGVWFYPTPERAAALTVEELREIQFSARKAEYIIGLSREIAVGNLDLDELSKKTDQEIIETLVKIRGIGKWTAESFLLFGVGRPNLFPKADIGLQKALKKLYGLPEKPTMEEMETYIKDWAPFLSYASLYLWRSIEKRSEENGKSARYET